ncbi:MAG: hypothetical protein ACJ78Q_00105 [Chloroflexia bacterium]
MGENGAKVRQLPAEKPAERATRLVYADWLEENVLAVEGFGQRWQAKHGKWPARREGRKRWAWWPDRDATHLRARKGEHAKLPPLVFLALRGAHCFTDHRFYWHLAAAELDLAGALNTLRLLLRV